MRDHDLCLEEYIQGLEDGSIVNPETRDSSAGTADTAVDTETDPGESSEEPAEVTEEPAETDEAA